MYKVYRVNKKYNNINNDIKKVRDKLYTRFDRTAHDSEVIEEILLGYFTSKNWDYLNKQ